MAGWVLILLLSIALIGPAEDVPLLMLRKYYHFVAVLMFSPVLLVDVWMLSNLIG